MQSHLDVIQKPLKVFVRDNPLSRSCAQAATLRMAVQFLGVPSAGAPRGAVIPTSAVCNSGVFQRNRRPLGMKLLLRLDSSLKAQL